MIYFEEHNESFLKVLIDDFGIEQELSEFFTFFAEGYKFQPKYESGVWDGKVRLFNLRSKSLPKGLLPVAIKFCEERGYPFTATQSLNPKSKIKETDIREFIDSIPVAARGEAIEVREYQKKAIVHSLQNYRSILLSPTSSGKSLILYFKIRYHLDVLDHNVVLVVPTTQLVEQMFSDFKDYSSINGWDVEEHCQILYSGKEKIFHKRVMISTWQSLNAMMRNSPAALRDIVERTDVGLFDEAHGHKGMAVQETMQKFIYTKWRTGTTGTLDNSKINKLQLIGLMGPPMQVITTRELMDNKDISDLEIKVLVLQYPKHIKKEVHGMKYADEIKYLIGNKERNQFITKLATACKGNTLILFSYVATHGGVLYDMIKAAADPDRFIQFIHGGVDVDDREDVRKIVETEKNAIIIATSSIFGTGSNIPSVENIIFVMPTKSTIRVRQSIGRGLRLKDGKSKCKLFDIADDLSTSTYRNTTLNHMVERIAIYEKEQFDFKIINVDLEKRLA